jgi:hypothetical protein
MISNKSRYANSKIVTETIAGKGDVVYITPSAPTAYTFRYIFYTVNGSDRIDDIANAYFSDPTQWHLIGDANPQVINWFSLTPGTIIRIPQVSVPQ